jgi:hypothetical protein
MNPKDKYEISLTLLKLITFVTTTNIPKGRNTAIACRMLADIALSQEAFLAKLELTEADLMKQFDMEIDAIVATMEM